MKNKIEDLRNHLFAQLERLGDKEVKPEELARAKAVVEVGRAIVDTARAETEFMRVTGIAQGTGFIPLAEAKLPSAPSRPQLASGSGRAR